MLDDRSRGSGGFDLSIRDTIVIHNFLGPVGRKGTYVRVAGTRLPKLSTGHVVVLPTVSLSQGRVRSTTQKPRDPGVELVRLVHQGLNG